MASSNTPSQASNSTLLLLNAVLKPARKREKETVHKVPTVCSLQTGRTDSARILKLKSLTVEECTQLGAIKPNAMSVENFYEEERSRFFNLTLNINSRVHKIQHKILIKFSVQFCNTSELDPMGLPFIIFHRSFLKGISHNIL